MLRQLIAVNKAKYELMQRSGDFANINGVRIIRVTKVDK
jgi:hypothetical protein